MQVTEVTFQELREDKQTIKKEIMFSTGFSTCVHMHDFYEVTVVVEGIAATHANGALLELGPGSVILFRPYDVHLKSDGGGGVIFSFALPIKAMRLMFSYLGADMDLDQIIHLKKPPIVMLRAESLAYYRTRFPQVLEGFRRDDALMILSAKSMLVDMMIGFYKISSAAGAMPAWLRGLSEEISKKHNFTEGITALSRLSGMTQEHICRSFKRYYGMSPTQYIALLRLNYSAQLLLETGMDVLDIALESGFSSLSHFYHCFKDQFGVSPKAYRKLGGGWQNNA